MKSPRLILDSNLYLNFLMSPEPGGTAAAALFDVAAEGAVNLLLPVDVIAELNDVIERRPAIRRRVSRIELSSFLARVAQVATVVPAFEGEPPRITRDQKDDYLIALAILHAADFLVTRDRDLLDLGDVVGVRIVEPPTLLALLQS